MASELDLSLPPGDADPLVRSAILADPNQRRILSCLLAQFRPTTERDLAVQLAARETGHSPADVTEEACQQFLLHLQHQWLPKLDAAGWIERHPEGIVLAERRSFERLGASLPEIESSDLPSWEALAALLARPRRRDVVSTVASHRRPLSLDELATALTASEYVSGTTASGETNRLPGTLHHVDLPKLDDVGLIEYDSDERTITRTSSLLTLVARTELADSESEAPDPM